MTRRERIVQASRRAERLEHDRRLVTPLYPHLRFVGEKREARVEGHVVVNKKFGSPEEIAVRIDFPSDYPAWEPRLYEVGKRFPYELDRHFYDDGFFESRCCLCHHLETQWREDDPDGILRFLEESGLFFWRQLICNVTGTFPGPQRKHGVEGTFEALTAQLGTPVMVSRFRHTLMLHPNFGLHLPCPCGRQRKFKNCHRLYIQEVRKRISPKHLQQMFAWLATTTR